MTTDSRIEELMKKGFGKLSFAEKAELNNLMAQNLQRAKQNNSTRLLLKLKHSLKRTA